LREKLKVGSAVSLTDSDKPIIINKATEFHPSIEIMPSFKDQEVFVYFELGDLLMIGRLQVMNNKGGRLQGSEHIVWFHKLQHTLHP
jgi:hypothetical protein